MKTTRPMPSFQGVAAGQTATLNMPIGLTYHGLYIKYSGVTLAQMAEMRFKGNGRELFTCSVSDLDVTNQFDTLNAASGVLYIPFDRPKLLTRAAQELSAIGTGARMDNDPGTMDKPNPFYNPTPLSTFQLEIDIDGAATAPALSAKALQSDPRPLGAFVKRRRFNYNISAGGTFEISDLPKGDLINRIWLKKQSGAGAITNCKLDRDNFLSFDRDVAENDLIQSNGVRDPQSGWYVIDPTENGFGAESIISAVNDFRLKIATSGAVDLVVYVDYLGGMSGN